MAETGTRAVTYAEAADLLTEWGDRRLNPVVGPAPEDLDWSLQEACDGLCGWLADDPEREDIADVPRPLLVMLKARLLFAIGACMLRKTEVIGRVPTTATSDLVLAGLLGIQLAGTRLPSEWRPQ